VSDDQHVTIDRSPIDAAEARDWYARRAAPTLGRRPRPSLPPTTAPGQPPAVVIDESAGAFVGNSGNFLPPSQRRSWVTPAGQSEYVVDDPSPGRVTAADRRQQRADIARAAEATSRLAGTNTVSRPKGWGGEWQRVDYRDRFGRPRTDWSRAEPRE
jgi:hypothetical protein